MPLPINFNAVLSELLAQFLFVFICAHGLRHGRRQRAGLDPAGVAHVRPDDHGTSVHDRRPVGRPHQWRRDARPLRRQADQGAQRVVGVQGRGAPGDREHRRAAPGLDDRLRRALDDRGPEGRPDGRPRHERRLGQLLAGRGLLRRDHHDLRAHVRRARDGVQPQERGQHRARARGHRLRRLPRPRRAHPHRRLLDQPDAVLRPGGRRLGAGPDRVVALEGLVGLDLRPLPRRAHRRGLLQARREGRRVRLHGAAGRHGPRGRRRRGQGLREGVGVRRQDGRRRPGQPLRGPRERGAARALRRPLEEGRRAHRAPGQGARGARAHGGGAQAAPGDRRHGRRRARRRRVGRRPPYIPLTSPPPPSAPPLGARGARWPKFTDLCSCPGALARRCRFFLRDLIKFAAPARGNPA